MKSFPGQILDESAADQLLLTEKELASVIYHDVFDYPLTAIDLIRWEVGDIVKVVSADAFLFRAKSGHYYLKGREGIVLRRLMRERSSKRKMKIAERAALLLSFIPTIKFVGITGALAMKNADDDADIDFLIITQKGTLWTTRLASLLLLKLFNFQVRRYGDKNEKDKLCLNMWLDEGKLKIVKRKNIYTAHELAQIVPLIDKGGTFTRLIEKNKWIYDYWPNAVSISRKSELGKKVLRVGLTAKLIEPVARKLQFSYMRGKITRETVTPRRAFFHPVDWGTFVTDRLKAKLTF